MTQNAAFYFILLEKAKIDDNYHEDQVVLIFKKSGGDSDLVWLFMSADSVKLLAFINGIKNTKIHTGILEKECYHP